MLTNIDAVIWLGDFNYRIGLDSETARTLVKQGNIDRLYDNDQLNLQMVAGLAFPFYSEARITFLPTYKFDIGTDQYDTSYAAFPLFSRMQLIRSTERKLEYLLGRIVFCGKAQISVKISTIPRP